MKAVDVNRLFSGTTMVVLGGLFVSLLGASFYTYLKDRELQSVSLGTLRMASWGLTQASNETHEFDKVLSLFLVDAADPDELMLRYDVLWSRYDYLLNSNESLFTRSYLDNTRRLQSLFEQFRAMEPDLLAVVSGTSDARPEELWRQWQSHKTDFHQLLIDNFVGDETSNLMRGVQQSRDRLSNLRYVTLGCIVALFSYLLFALRYFRRRTTTNESTGLPNEHYLKELKALESDRALIACEIQDMHLLLAGYDAETAEEVIRSFVRKLSRTLSPEDEIIQVAPSEFVIIARLPKDKSAEAFACALQDSSRFSWQIGSVTLEISGVFGIACSASSPSLNTQEYLRYAIRARSECHEKNLPVAVFNDHSKALLKKERQVQAELVKFFQGGKSALELSLVYQPIVDIDDIHNILGAEVLLRCRDQEGQPYAPDWLVGVCEKHGLGLELGRWIFRQVESETRYLYSELGFQGSMAINLNPAMLGEHLVEEVSKGFLRRGFPADRLCLEITEDNAGLNIEKVNRFIARLRSMDVSFALDDFGTGHSSLSYLQELQIDRLKIDRSFVNDIEKNDERRQFLASIIAMSRQAFMTTIVEGVENEHQWELVKSMGSVWVQGYVAYRPMPILKFMEVLQAEAAVASHTNRASKRGLQ